ncbi:MAG: glycosyltransferase [Desulfovibrio sp.]|jgi:glycosyltransferase involved in cell wall biosynthesis|nr:glycosyltransferase [Desulfovibrio sp.]
MYYSIIIATLNSSRFLDRALRSILVQKFGGYEILVQDGGSTDGTLDILKKYGKRISWNSEADRGIYDAWNKAVGRSRGDWILFLGADDFLLSENILGLCAGDLSLLPSETIFAYGRLALGRNGRPATRIHNSLTAMYSLFFRGTGLPFSATFIRSSVFARHRFDSSFTIAGDLEFTLRLLSADNVAALPHAIAFMENGGISDSAATADLLCREKSRILRELVLPKAGLIAEACLKYLAC